MKKVNECVICKNPLLDRYDCEIVPFVKDRMFDDMDIKSDFLYCPNCNFGFSEVRPDDNELVRYYQNYMTGEYMIHRKKYEKSMEEYEKFLNSQGAKSPFMLKIQSLGELLERNIDISKIENALDFGGADGSCFPDTLKDVNKFVYDIDEKPVIDGVSKISKEDLKNKKWDLILCSQTLEHVSYPMDLINEMTDLLAEGGYLSIDVPFEKEYLKLVNGSAKKIHVHEHINRFSPKTFEKIFNSMEYAITDLLLEYYVPKNAPSHYEIITVLVKKLAKNEDAVQLKTMYSIKNKLYLIENQLASQKLVVEQENPVSFLQKLFSVKNEKKHKIIRILGIKISLRRNKKK